MKEMKKILAGITAMTMICGMTACGNTDEDNNSSNEEEKTTTTTTAVTVEVNENNLAEGEDAMI